MPHGNNFEHAAYVRSDPGERVGYREYTPDAPPGSPAWQDAMAQHGGALARAGVQAVIYLHGAMLGTDPFGVQRLDQVGGLKRGYSRGIPGIDGLLALMREGTNGLPALPAGLRPPLPDDAATRALLDELSGDAANFSATTVDTCAKALAASASLSCRRWLWSCEHHHLGRTKAAVDLARRLGKLANELNVGPGARFLILAHGHVGQVCALLSNLLSAENSNRTRVLELAGQPASDLAAPLRGTALDIVTLGTPVRYGWETSTIGHLLHLINHRMMRTDSKRWLAKMELPQITMEMPIAWGGDYLQQLAVAGCDAVPSTEADQARNKALWELLEPYEGFERWLECVRKCVRCPSDGRCLLIDYKDGGSSTAKEHYYGHAAYTRMAHQLFQTGEVVRALYA